LKLELLLLTIICGTVSAQHEGHDMAQTAEHEHGQPGGNAAGEMLMEQASGTSMNPRSWRMPMLMKSAGGWKVMFMGQAFIADTQQSGPRGGDKLYSTNWGMFAAEHAVGGGAFMFQSMFSLEPATVTQRRYPELFQTGETAFGRPLTDAQHPHDLFMGLGVHYAHPVGERGIVQVYFAPIGDPALGPVAFPHRASAAELPQAPLGHHWQDSTHIASDVITIGLTRGWLRFEASGFHGAEPNENRWNIDQGKLDSWSARLSVFPAKNWMAQVSAGRLTRPERQDPGDVVRATASLHYTRPLAGGDDWSSSFVWGRNHSTLNRRDTNSYLLESVAPIRRRNFVTGRFELVDKDELFNDNPDFAARLARTAASVFRIGAYTVGYTRDVGSIHNLEAGLGANITAYTLPRAIQPFYGEHPVGATVYLRFRLRPAS
jgi:hypothetical protein